MKIYTIAMIPDNLVQKWLQHLRDFDQSYKAEGCHFEVVADAPQLSLQEMVSLLQVDPALSFAKLFRRPISTDDETD